MAQGVDDVITKVLVQQRSKAVTWAVVIFCSFLGMGCDFVRRAGYRAGLVTFSPQSDIELSFVVQDSQGNPLGHVAVVNELGEELGTSAEGSGIVTITEKFSRSTWYFRPPLELAGRSGAKGQTSVAGRLLVLSERERVLGQRPIAVQLNPVVGVGGGDPSDEGLVRDEERDFAKGWESFREAAPSLPGRPLVGAGSASFVEEDLDDGAADSQSLARAGAEESVTNVLTALNAPSLVNSESFGRLRNFVTDSETPRADVKRTQVDEPAPSAVAAVGAVENPASLGDAALGTLRRFDGDPGNGAFLADSAKRQENPVRPETASFRRKSAEETETGSKSEHFVAAKDVNAARFPKAFARMESWGLPAERIRRLSFVMPDTASAVVNAGPNVAGESGDVVRVFGISTQKEAEIELGSIPIVADGNGGSSENPENVGKASARLDVLVPDAARFDLVRAELPGCGGIVTPLLASSPAAPQELSCAKLSPSINKSPGWTQTIGVMYLAHGVMRYFRGGKIDAGAQTADVSGNLSLFRLSVPLASEINPSLPVVHLRHPDVEGGEAALEQTPLDSVALRHARPNAHRVVALKNLQNPKPRVSLVVRRDEGVRHVDGALVGRFQRAFFAHFVNSKFFVPVPWQTLEQQLGTALSFEKTIAEGWRGSVLDILLDYTIVLQPRERSIVAAWYDREGKIRGQKEHPYRPDIPPELLAREVYDGLLDHLPVGNAAQTAIR